MKVNSTLVNITSKDPARLLKFYMDVVGLPKTRDQSVDAAGTTLAFDSHSEVRGAASEPARVLINFFVDNIAAASIPTCTR